MGDARAACAAWRLSSCAAVHIERLRMKSIAGTAWVGDVESAWKVHGGRELRAVGVGRMTGAAAGFDFPPTTRTRTATEGSGQPVATPCHTCRQRLLSPRPRPLSPCGMHSLRTPAALLPYSSASHQASPYLQLPAALLASPAPLAPTSTSPLPSSSTRTFLLTNLRSFLHSPRTPARPAHPHLPAALEQRQPPGLTRVKTGTLAHNRALPRRAPPPPHCP